MVSVGVGVDVAVRRYGAALRQTRRPAVQATVGARPRSAGRRRADGAGALSNLLRSGDGGRVGRVLERLVLDEIVRAVDDNRGYHEHQRDQEREDDENLPVFSTEPDPVAQPSHGVPTPLFWGGRA